MNRRHWGLAGAGLLLAIVAALLAAPEFVDWDVYRGEISHGIEARLGRAVAIDGPLKLSLLPTPHLTAEKVRVANVAGATDADFATVGRLELRLRLLPLLGGHFEVSSLLLIKPQIHLQRLADGRANWRFLVVGSGSAAAPAAASGVARGTGEPVGAVIKRVELRQAVVTFRHPRLGLLTADQIDGEASAQSNQGPYQFDFKARVTGVALEAEGSVGDLDAAETPANFAATLGDNVARIGVGGVLTGRDAATSFNGKLNFKAAHLDRLAALVGGTPLPDGKFDLQGGLTATLHDVGLQSLTIDAPGASVLGFAALNFEGDPQLDLKLATARLDLGPWSVAAPPPPAPADNDPKHPRAAAPNGETKPTLGMGISLPTWLGASIDLAAESVAWRGAVLRGARFNAQLANGEVTVNQVGATLPGDSQVNLFGFLSVANGRPSFDGSFESGSDDLRALLRWLAIDVGRVPADRLGAARFTGHLVAAPERIKLDNAELRVDGTRVDTAIDLRLPEHEGERPALGASFVVDTLNADAYWPKPEIAPSAALSASAGLGSMATPAIPQALVPTAISEPLSGPVGRTLGAFDANLKGHLGQLVAGGLSFRGLDLDGALTGGSLALNSLSVADLNGTQARISGRIDGLGEKPRLVGVKVEAHSDDPHRLLGALGATVLPGDPGALALSAQIDGDADGVAIQSHGEFGGVVGNVDGRIATPLTQPGFDLAIDASDPTLAGALRLVGIDYRRRAGAEAASARFHLTGTRAKLAFDDLRLQAGKLAATGHATLDLAAKPRLDAALTVGELPLDPLFGGALMGAPAPRAALAPVPAPAKAGPANPDAPPPPQAAPRAPVDVGGIPERFSHAPLGLDWMNSLDGSLTLDGAALMWGSPGGGLRLGQPNLAVTLADGKATVDKFSAQLWGGTLSASAALDSAGALSFEAKLSQGQLKDASLGLADLDLAEGSIDASFDLTATGNSPAEMMGRLAGTGTIESHDGVLKGFDLNAANERLAAPSAASLITLAQAAMKGGQTRFSALTGTIKASGGIFTSDDLKLVAEGGTMEMKGAANLPAYALDMNAKLHFDAAPTAPPLAMHIFGPLDAPRRVLDINPLQIWLAQRGKK